MSIQLIQYLSTDHIYKKSQLKIQQIAESGNRLADPHLYVFIQKN